VGWGLFKAASCERVKAESLKFKAQSLNMQNFGFLSLLSAFRSVGAYDLEIGGSETLKL
jgi:hypothetical protein